MSLVRSVLIHYVGCKLLATVKENVWQAAELLVEMTQDGVTVIQLKF